MKIETKAAIFTLVLIVVAVLSIVIAAGQIFPSVCLPLQGIDHNGKDEAFTVFLGNC